MVVAIRREDGRRLYELTEIMNTGAVGDTHHDVSPVLAAQMQMFQYGTELAARKREAPGDDIATSLLQTELDGERLTDLEFNMFFLLLINAGGDTTRNLVAATKDTEVRGIPVKAGDRAAMFYPRCCRG